MKHKAAVAVIAIATLLAALWAAMQSGCLDVQLDENGITASITRTLSASVFWDEYVERWSEDPQAWQLWAEWELRRNGEVIDARPDLLSCRPNVDSPGAGQCGSPSVVSWDMSALLPGSYATHLRLYWTDSSEEIPLPVRDAEGPDERGFYKVDEQQVGRLCILPLTVVISK